MKWFFLFLPGLLVWMYSCHPGAHRLDTSEWDTTLFARPERVGVLNDPALTEVSGLAASRQNPGYFWTEEDSGNPNQIQLISPKGFIVARFTLPALKNKDWEEIAVGPGPVRGLSYVYLAEIGDNMALSASKVVYRFVEPDLTHKKLPVNGLITDIQAIQLTIPDGAENAEAILIDPVTTDLYILGKGARSRIYRAAYPQSLTGPTRMQPVIELPIKNVTAASVSPDGTEILIRNYAHVYYYQRRPGESVGEALKRTPRSLPLAYEPQGEAIGWALDGSGYYTTTEMDSDDPQLIYFYRRLVRRGKL